MSPATHIATHHEIAASEAPIESYTPSNPTPSLPTPDFASLTTIKARVAYIRAKLGSDAAWALRGLTVIHSHQTFAEQEASQTVEDNGIGFTGLDAVFLTSLYNSYQRYGSLTAKQMEHLFRKMPKYAAQLERVARAKTCARETQE